ISSRRLTHFARSLQHSSFPATASPHTSPLPYTTLFRSTLAVDAGQIAHPALPGGSVAISSATGRLRWDAATSRLALEDLFIDLRSEEHTSELQSRENLVCRLLLEKKKEKRQQYTTKAKY